MLFRSFSAQALAAGMLYLLSLPPAIAQSYPTQPVKIVVPFAVGGGVDVLTRVLAERMGKELSQTVIVENRVGAGGNLGSDYVAKAKPDGYTLLVATTGTHAINPILYPSLPFDTKEDFTPISLIAAVPNVLVVGPRFSVKTLAELIAALRSSPGKHSYASFGNGTSNHLSGELLKLLAQVDAVHIPYKSATQAVTDLMGGQIDFAFVNIPLALPHIKGGKLHALAVTSPMPIESLPNVPTMAQAGLEGFVVESWYGLMAPKGLAPETISLLERVTANALRDTKVREIFSSNGAEVRASSSTDFATLIATERVRWADVIQRANVRID